MQYFSPILLFLFLNSNLYAQQDSIEGFLIHFHPIFNGQPLQINGETALISNETLSIETFKFYLSNFTCLKSGEPIWREESHHLIDASDPGTLSFVLKTPTNQNFDSIQFLLGIDSLTNVSGAMGGDLDPIKGMYWAWNSGYINFKLEGTSSLCPSRKNEFHFHLGGYMAPFKTVQNIKLKVPSKKEMTINIDLSKFIEQIDLNKQFRTMSPGAEAKKLSQIASTLFYCDDE